MTKDRIKDLQKPIQWPHVSYRRVSRQRRGSDPPTVLNQCVFPLATINTEYDQHVAEFLTQIDLIRKLIDKIAELATEVKFTHKKMIEPMADPKLSHQLDDKTDDIKKAADVVAAHLKKLEQTQKDAKDDIGSAQWRLKESQIYNITKHFRQIMNQYNEECVAHRDRCKKAIKREFEISGIRRTDDEIEDMIENGFPGTFSFSIMVDVEKARQAVHFIEQRHQDITKLENSIKQLHSIFADLAMLVATQGEMIDNIEYNVIQATDFVGKATDDIVKTAIIAAKAKKKKTIVCVILTVVIVVLIIIFVTYFSIQKKIF
ncbi:unnamed protein product [Rotaria socialis]